jgi:hypothetical protein
VSFDEPDGSARRPRNLYWSAMAYLRLQDLPLIQPSPGRKWPAQAFFYQNVLGAGDHECLT